MSDPTQTYFTPYQAAVADDQSRYQFTEKSSRIGITHCLAGGIVRNCQKERWDPTWWYLANDKATAGEFIFKDIKFFAELWNVGYSYLGDEIIDEDKDIRGFSVRFKNGRRIFSLSSNAGALYGKGGNVILDEFARHPQARELYKAAQRAIFWGGRLIILSQHDHENTEFNQLTKQIHAAEEGRIRAGIDILPWKHFHITIKDAVNQGIFEKLKTLGATEANSRDEFLALLRAGCRDEGHFNQMYMCIPTSEADAFITYETIDPCTDPMIECLPQWAKALVDKAEAQYLVYRTNSGIDPDPHNGELLEILDRASADLQGELYLGADVARHRDLYTIWLSRRQERRVRTIAVPEFLDRPFFILKKITFALLALANLRVACIDKTGIGEQISEEAVDKFGTKVIPVNFNNENKNTLANLVKPILDDKLIELPSANHIRESIHSVKKTSTATGHPKFDADRTDQTGHADHFWALALCLNAMSGAPISVDFVASREKLASSQISM
jgi:phage FluMu gp28-like protein